MITLQHIDEFFDNNANLLESFAKEFEGYIVEARDKKTVPIYLTKVRVKAKTSCFLKVKRKRYSSLADISDLVGFRVLCLFEQDVPVALSYLVKFLADKTKQQNGVWTYKIQEIAFFNWNATQLSQIVIPSLKGILANSLPESSAMRGWRELKEIDAASPFPRKRVGSYTWLHNTTEQSIAIRDEVRGSGYKSIHIVATTFRDSVEIPFEIQLRTFIQDVWGELEHSLNYKGTRLPQIQKAFQLLASELQAKDQLISDLREVLDRHTIGRKNLEGNLLPGSWYGYEKPDVTLLVQHIPEAQDYLTLMETYQRDATAANGWTQKPQAEALWATLLPLLESENQKQSPATNIADVVRLFETAFWSRLSQDLDKALDCYDELHKNPTGADRWVLPFRHGEVYLQRGMIDKALYSFDLCESIFSKLPITQRVAADKLRMHAIATNLAHVYWSLGPDFVEIAIEKAQLAVEMLNDATSSEATDRPKRKLHALSNLCFYLQEHALNSGPSTSFNFALLDGTLNQLMALMESILKTEQAASIVVNVYDTLAWCCYNKAIREKSGSTINYNHWLGQACAWIGHVMQASGDLSPLGLYAYDLRRQHIEFILTEKARADSANNHL
jgi:ppGpp synthetase/RelA/SpoT-type nucleotidyltranferase